MSATKVRGSRLLLWVYPAMVSAVFGLPPVPAASAHFIPPERQVAPAYALVPAAGVQAGPGLLFGPGQYLAIWGDARDAAFAPHFVVFGTDVFGARIGTSGDVLDRSGKELTRAESWQQGAKAAWGATHYLIVWEDGRGGQLSEDLYFTLATPSLRPLWPEGRPLCTQPGASVSPAVGWDGQRYLVVWQDERGGRSDIYAARISSEGEVLDPEGFPVCQAPADQFWPALAWSGSRYLIVWNDGRSLALPAIYGVLYEPDGLGLLPEFVICEAPGVGMPAVAWDGQNFIVAWADYRAGQADIFAAHISPDGAVLEPGGFPVVATAEPEVAPAVACAGQTCLIGYQLGLGGMGSEPADVMGALLSPWGGVQTFTISAHAGKEQSPAVATDGAGYLCAWGDTRINEWGTDEGDIFAARITPDGQVLDPGGFRVTWSAEHRQNVAVAFGGEQYLAAWTEASGNFNIACARLDANGIPIDQSAIVVSANPAWERFPDVVATPRGYFVVWQDERNYQHSGSDLYMAWVDRDGQVYPSAGGMPLYVGPDDQEAPAVAWDGAGKLLVTWHQLPGGDIWGLIFDSQAGGAGDAFPICLAEQAQFDPRVAFDGTNFMVIWWDLRGSEPPHEWVYDLYAARVTPQGLVLDPDGFRVTADPAYERWPRISWNGQAYLAVYGRRDASGAEDVYGVWVSADAVVSQPFPIAADPVRFELGPDVSWDGVAHAVAFTDYPGRLCVATLLPGQIGLLSVDCFEPALFSRAARITAGPRCRHLIAYESRWFDPPYGSYRIFSRQFVRFPLGDLNCDGFVNAFDIDPFVLALTSTPPEYPEYYAVYPACDAMLADANGDGLLNAFDIDPFVALLTGF